MLIALRWFGKGGMLSEVAAFHGVSRSSVSRIIKKVSGFFISIRADHISYPDDR